METWIVSGGTHGLGRAMVEALCQNNRNVIFFSRTAKDVKALQGELGDQYSLHGHIGSVGDPTFVKSLLENTVETMGPITGLVINAAAITPVADVVDLNVNDLSRMLSTNVLGALYLLQAAVPNMLLHRRGKIITFTSDAGHAAYPGWSGYGMTKAALNLLIKTFSQETPSLETHLVDPGDMDTQMHHLALPDDPGPLRDPRDVARALLPLIDHSYPSASWALQAKGLHQLELKEVES